MLLFNRNRGLLHQRRLPAYGKAPLVTDRACGHRCFCLQDEGVTLRFELWGARGSEGQRGTREWGEQLLSS